MSTDSRPSSADLYIGVMTGTSIDGLDLCLCDFSQASPRLVAHRHQALGEDLAASLRRLARGETGTELPPPLHDQIDCLGVADRRLAETVASGINALLDDAGISRNDVKAVGSHGQSVRHRPDWGDAAFTLQLGDPSIIAERTGVTVVADFRRRDLAAGGQGAPLAPPAHAAIFPPDEGGRIVINLGGIANVSVLRPGVSPLGFDTGPANTLMDAWHARHRHGPFDRDGVWAASGEVEAELLDALLDEPFFAQPTPKSTGPERFNLQWLEARGGARLAELPPANVQATLLELTVESIATALSPWRQAHGEMHGEMPITLCGGGAYNRRLVARLQQRLGATVTSSAALGIPPECVEGVVFAWLARQLLTGLPGNAPSVTGAAGPRLLGGIYPA